MQGVHRYANDASEGLSEHVDPAWQWKPTVEAFTSTKADWLHDVDGAEQIKGMEDFPET